MWSDWVSNAGKTRTEIKNIEAATPFKGSVIGIDASLRGTGIAIVDFSGNVPALLFSKKIACPANFSFAQCIGKIFQDVSEILKQFKVDCAAIEQTIYVQNYKISHILGAAKGAAIAALMQKNLSLVEYEPLRIKKAITGVGRASKEQIRKTVAGFLNLSKKLSYDESDAIAAAFCHFFSSGRHNFGSRRS